MRRIRRNGLGLLLSGVLGLALAAWGLWRDIGWIAQPFYAHAWWSYILALDGFVAMKRGDSLFTTRRSLLLPLTFWSITFWFFFELLNLRYQNWYYVGVFEVRSIGDLILRTVFSIACFATVFLGLFETYEALTASGLLRRWKIRTTRFAPWISYAVQGLGLLMITLSLVASEYLAPLVWGSVTLIVDPWNYRRGARSLMRDLERGDVGLVARVVLAGLACGLVWESLNYFAPQKWVYTVNGLENFKLFEMPLLGFFGFPALALDAFAAYSVVSYRFHGNVTWESPADCTQLLEPRPGLSRISFVGLVLVVVLFWGGVSHFVQRVAIGSVECRLEALQALPPNGATVLRREGIRRPRQLLKAARNPTRLQDLQSTLELSDHEMRRLLQEVRLYTFKGIGSHHGEMLRRAGIERVEDLASADAVRLYEELVKSRHGSDFPALRPAMVRVWVLAARREAG